MSEAKGCPVIDVDLKLVWAVVQIAKYLYWKDESGFKQAQEIIDRIHAGDFGDKQGVWPQVHNALLRIEKQLTENCNYKDVEK